MTTISYDSGKDTLYGDKLMLYIEIVKKVAAEDGNETETKEVLPIAFGTSCNIDLSADTLDSTNKMSGDWKEALVGQVGWTMGSESLLSKKDGHLSFKTLKKIFVKRDPILVLIGKTKEDDAASDGFACAEEFVKGRAVITNLSMTAQTGQFCTCSIQLQGHGALDDGLLQPATTEQSA